MFFSRASLDVREGHLGRSQANSSDTLHSQPGLYPSQHLPRTQKHLRAGTHPSPPDPGSGTNSPSGSVGGTGRFPVAPIHFCGAAQTASIIAVYTFLHCVTSFFPSGSAGFGAASSPPGSQKPSSRALAVALAKYHLLGWAVAMSWQSRSASGLQLYKSLLTLRPEGTGIWVMPN